MPAGEDGGEPQTGVAEVSRHADDHGVRRARRGLHRLVDVRTLRSFIETDLAASQAIFGQSPFGFLLFDTDLKVGGPAARSPRCSAARSTTARGHTVHDYLPRHGADRVQGALRRVLETGDAVTDMQLVGPAPGSSRAPPAGPSTSIACTAVQRAGRSASPASPRT
ncbi:PAS domain-containing protein [Streptomyces sp. KL116D]|uniref:PAS domain-containing protein n=1 Tax=Streptomyces sp. KL116D TaxID=3045152 RepID=UPI0035592942